ncbi:MAG: hypothetical protein QM628_18215 [Propionicimonas sp.]|jgi:hypothetical protein
MAIATIMMLVILGIALAIIAIVAIGMQGNPRPSASQPKVRKAMARTAKHLNGEAPPPPGLVSFLDDLRIKSASSGAENTGEQPKVS